MKRILLLLAIVSSLFIAVNCYASPITTKGAVWLVDLNGDGNVSLNIYNLLNTDYNVGYLKTPGVSTSFEPLLESGNILAPGAYDFAIQKTGSNTYALSDDAIAADDYNTYSTYDVYFYNDASVEGIYTSFRISWIGIEDAVFTFDYSIGGLDSPDGAAPSPVPIPPTVLLLGSGLLGILGVRKKTSK